MLVVVRFGSNAEVRAGNRTVRFALKNGHRQPGLSGPKSAKPGSRHDATSGFKLVKRSVLLV